jgi:hypothetical protein
MAERNGPAVVAKSAVSNLSPPPVPVSWSDVARVCRKVCVLRERGQSGEAEQLRAQTLPELLAALKTPTDTDAAIAQRVESIFAVETERIANATVLAELLVPLLSEQLRGLAVPPNMISASLSPAPPPPPPPKPPARAATISIADFIDDMIAQENPPPRGGRASRQGS